MASLGEAVLDLRADRSQLERDLRGARLSVEGALGGLAAVGGALVEAGLAAAAAGIAALGGGLAWSVKQAMDAEAVQAQLNAVLQSTGGVAGVTAEQVNGLADELSQLTPFEDEAIVSAESMLLTFTNIGQDVFPDATRTVLDMSQALGQDLQQSAVQLGKALQDPIEGVTTLRRVGVNFSDAQMEMIRAMVEAGDVAGAQRYILEELQTEFGGSAEAAGKTFAGKLKILQTQLGNIGETIGNAVLPVLSELATQLLDYLARPEVQAGIAAIAQGLADFAARAAAALPKVIGWLQRAFGWLAENKGVIVGALAAIGVAIGAWVYAVVIPAAVAAVSAMLPVIAIMAAVGLAAYLLYEAWTNNWGGIRTTLTAWWAAVQPYFAQAAQWLATNIPLALQALKQVWDNVWIGIQAIVGLALPIIRNVVRAFQAAMRGDWYQFGASLRAAWDAAWKAISTVIVSVGTKIFAAIQNIVAKIISTIKSTDWLEIGRAIIEGIAQGIKNGINIIIDAAKAAAQAALDAAKGFLGIQSPSRVFRLDVAGNMMSGWALGIRDAIPQLQTAVEQTGAISVSAAMDVRALSGAQMATARANESMTFYAPVTFRVGDERTLREIMRSMRG